MSASTRMGLVFTIVLALVCGYVAVTTAAFLFPYAPRVPFWDHWRAVVPQTSLAHLFAQNNEHRIAVGRLLLAVDDWWFSGRGRSSQIFVVVSVVLCALLLAESAWQATRARWTTLAVFSLSGALLLGAYSWENLLWPFQITFVPVFPATVGAFSALSRKTVSRRDVKVAVVCSLVASGTIVSGIFVAPALALLSFLRGQVRHATGFVVLTVVVAVLYFQGYEWPPHPGARPTALLVVRYVCVMLGAPFTYRYGPERVPASEHLGAFVVLVVVAGAIHALLRRRTLHPAAWTPLFTALFVFGMSVLTGIGRGHLGIDSAFASRYGTGTLLLWASLIAYAVIISGSSMRDVALAAACAPALLVASEQDAHAATGAALMRDRTRDAETAFLSGGLEVAAVDKVTFLPSLALEALPSLRAQHLSVFSDAWASWLGQAASRVHETWDDGACIGSLESARAVAAFGSPAFRLEGWVGAPDGARPPERIVFVDSDGLVVGYARAAFSGTALPARSLKFTGHIGDIPSAETTIRAAAVVRDGHALCRFGEPMALRREDALPLVRR